MDRYKSRHRSSYVIANLRLGRCQKPKNMKKTFPFQLKFNRFPTFHYVRGWLWLVHGQLFRTPLHCRRGCCRFCSLSRFSLALLLIYTVAIRCYWCSRWSEACKSASAQKAVPSRFLEVNFRSNTCRCGCRCRPQFFAPPHRLVQDRCFYPADLFQVVDFTAQSRPFFRPISKSSSEYDDFSFLRFKFHVLSRVISEFILCILFKWWR